MALKISRILHAGYVFEHGNYQIAFDPILANPFSRNCHAFPNVKFDHGQIRKLNFAAIFISHFHDDHCCLESLDCLDRKTPIYIYCIFEELAALIKELGFVEVHHLRIDAPVLIGAFEVTPRRALDSEVDSIFHIRVGDLNVLNVVDSWIDPSTLNTFAQFAPWDMILWPFQTMREIEVLAPSRARSVENKMPVEWIEQLRSLKPRYIVPSSCQFLQESWSWYNHALFPISYRQFEREIRAVLPDTQVKRMNPGVAVNLNKKSVEKSSPLSWVEPVGRQDLDYDYRPDLIPPTTAEISKKFYSLTEPQKEEVYNYCRSEMLEKYKSLDPSFETYFKQPRKWRLSIYDHTGEVRHFYYTLNRQKIVPIGESEEPLAWTTELPIAKLYAALKNGESLTSMYVRINDMVFTSAIEAEIHSVDILEDPLIRCLFNGTFGSYQIAQLERITTRR